LAKARFFLAGQIGESVEVEITGPDARHIKDVLRLSKGDMIEVVDSEGIIAEVRIEGFARGGVLGRIVGSYKAAESLPQVYLFQGLPKAGKLDTIVRQATEIGVSGISPILTERVVVKLEAQKAAKKSDRWQKIATEAAKQSHRISIPKVTGVLSWQEALEELKKFDHTVVFWEEEHEKLLFEALKPEVHSIALVIGPEGGLAEKEVADLKDIGAEVVTLGESILRTETAGPVAVALTLYELRRMKKTKQSP